MADRGLLIVISGFAGSGKGTVVKQILADRPDRCSLSTSVTTRSPRPGEKEGVAYFFRTKEEFERMIERSELIEYARYVDNYYGTPKAWVEQKMKEGIDVILEIEIQGAMNIKKMYPDAILIFLMPPGADELQRRLVGRGTEDAATVRARLARACEEAEGIGNYDYLVVNDEVQACADRIGQIADAERLKVSRQAERIRDMRQGLEKFRA
ncbi:MAG: guanylate kinase [Lachnospira sp.]|nr:guanylate kinase [Lachnospira sp.]